MFVPAIIRDNLHYWKATLENPNESEIFLSGITGRRYGIPAQTDMLFNINISAVSGADAATFNLKGIISNRAALAFIGTIGKEISNDGTDFDCNVEADVANSALIIKVSGTGTIIWQATGFFNLQ